MKSENGRIILYDNPEDFLKVICELQEQFNSSSDNSGVDLNEW